MDREQIIQWAREAECSETFGMDAFRFTVEELERFAALIAAAEREACAKACEINLVAFGHGAAHWNDAVNACAAAIRARGNHA